MRKHFLCLVVLGIITLGTVNNVFPIYLGYKATPPGQVYLGTIHHPDDYFYYLSQFTQGRESWFFSRDLYASDFPHKTIVGWVNVVMGRIGYTLGLNGIQSYHISVVVLTTGFIFSIYLLFRQSIRKQKYKSIVSVLALFLFVISNSFSFPQRQNGQLVWNQIDYWFNFGTPGQRLGGVPHHLLMHTIMALLLLFLILYARKRIRGGKLVLFTALTGMLSFTLASIQPLHWITIGLISAVLCIHQVWSHRKGISFNTLLYSIWPSFVIGAFGVLPALTLKQLFSAPPYSQLPAWEFVNSVMATPTIFLLGLGPVAFIAIASLLLLRKRVFEREFFVLFSYTVISMSLFFSPISSLVKLQNVRFLSSLTVAGISLVAAYGLVVMADRLGRKGVVLSIVLVVVTSLLTVPSHYARLIAAQKTGVGNAYIYVDRLVIEAMEEARKISSPSDIFAVMWPYHISFPAISGRTIYYGHPLLTINSEEKGKLNYHFFSNIVSVPEQEEFLRSSNIAYVIAEPWAMQLIKVSNITPVYKNNALWIAKVTSEK